MKEEIERLVKIAESKPVIKRMWFFGSRFKNTHNNHSDLDIAIEVQWVKGQNLGYCSDPLSLWIACTPKFEYEMTSMCPWVLDIQQYAGKEETPNIHNYLNDASELIYQMP